jgi:hypothetical protein
MLKQIIVAMAGAIAAQLTAATLDFAPAARHDHFETPAATSPAIVTATQDFFAMPSGVVTVSPFLGALQVANRQ